MSLDRLLLVDRRVGVAYAALLAVFPHSEPAAAVETLDRVPPVLLILFAILAIPALALTLAVGAVLSLVGLPPDSLPTLLLARGDMLYFTCALVVAVASAWTQRRTSALTV